ncbi:MAG: hypothetical protein E2O68_01135 [Deltaproteobacteria bacterium]|nr:MAG: hypothetical protein E2O68_01135 [Deltaproteobacteria bacterium]
MNKILLIITLFSLQVAQANDVCSRICMVNDQEILIDLNTNQKGEGLRNYLEKDSVASMYLEKYQKNNEFHWTDAALGTAGAVMVGVGLLANLETKQKTAVAVSGAVLIVANFVIGYSLKNANEKNLERAIEEYNKRNEPKIFMSPLSYKNTQNIVDHNKIVLSKSWSF